MATKERVAYEVFVRTSYLGLGVEGWGGGARMNLI